MAMTTTGIREKGCPALTQENEKKNWAIKPISSQGKRRELNRWAH
jgi:hypothetical protein